MQSSKRQFAFHELAQHFEGHSEASPILKCHLF